LPVPSGEVKTTQAPVLLTEEGTDRAAALDSVTWMRDPFPLNTIYNFSPDQRTRLVLFARNVELQAGEEFTVVKAQVEDSQRKVTPLTVEYVGKVSGSDWLTQIVVRLPDGIETGGDASLSIEVRGLPSNKVPVRLKNF
jgi:hypothetical protein